MKSKIILLHRSTGDTITLKNTFKDLSQCIEHLDTIKNNKKVIIKRVVFEEE